MDSPVEERSVERAVAGLQYRCTWRRDRFERKYGRHTLDLLLFYEFAYVVPIFGGMVCLGKPYRARTQSQLKAADAD